MKDEIKEILMSMEFGDGKNYQLTSEITISEWNKIIDYITNLQDKVEWYENIEINKTIDKFRLEHNKEIKRLKKENDSLNSYYEYYKDLADKQNKLMRDYKSRCEKLELENERLKETNVYCNRTDCIGRIKDSRKYDSVYQEKEDYKSRIDKAVDYINHSQNYGTMAQVMPHLKPYVNGNDLLNILQGVGKDE